MNKLHVYSYLPFYIFSFFSISVLAWTDSKHASALQSLKLSFDSPSVLQSWVGDDPCGENWNGIYCIQNEVTIISLPNSELAGTLSPQIADISSLIAIDFTGNPEITGSIPSTFTSLKNLVSLRLQNCGLSGAIPSDLGAFSSLQYLYIGGNQLTGEIPPSISNLTQLIILDLSNNNLSGGLPFPGVYSLLNLKILNIENNRFSGSLSSNFSSLLNLRNISISNCNFNGSLPSFSEMQNLMILNVSHNKFSGGFPPEIGRDIFNLNIIDVSNTTLSGKLNFVLNLPNLQVFNGDYCSFNGAFPNLAGLKNLTTFSLLANNISSLSSPIDSYDMTVDIELYQNPVCAYYSLGLAPFCLPPESIIQKNYTSSPFCTRTKCKKNEFPNYFHYLNTKDCVCSEDSIVMILSLFPSFSFFNNDQAHSFSFFLSSILSLDSSQIYLRSLNVTNKKYVEIYVSLFSKNGKFTSNDIFLFEKNVAIGFNKKNYGVLKSVAFVLSNSIEKNTLSKGILAVIIILSTFLFLCLVLLLIGIIFWREKKSVYEIHSPINSSARRSDDPVFSPEHSNPPKKLFYFKLKEIKTATSNFSTLIGRGYRSIVYKGIMPSGKIIAIKRAKGSPKQNISEFKEMLEGYSRINHPNIVDLIGYCCEKNEQILVYEFMHLGSLADLLHGITINDSSMEPLSWKERIDISFEVAKGINYLHERNIPIIHRNLKPSNVLLNEKMEVKISDLLILLNSDDYQISFANENQYVDPDYKRRGVMTLKSDVYSFGVLLLELISGIRLSGSNEVFSPQGKKKQLWELGITVDAKMGEFNVKEMQTLINLSRQCMEVEASLRPSMTEIVKELYFMVYPNDGRGQRMVLFSHTPDSTENAVGSSRISANALSNPNSFRLHLQSQEIQSPSEFNSSV